MKKVILFIVLLCSAMAQLCAQTCNTCQGGIIARCPTGAPHDVKNVYMCYKDAQVLGIGESSSCDFAVQNNQQISFTPHKNVVIHPARAICSTNTTKNATRSVWFATKLFCPVVSNECKQHKIIKTHKSKTLKIKKFT